MSARLIAIGDNKYINPNYIMAIYDRDTAHNEKVWVVRLRDGAEFIIDNSRVKDILYDLS